MVVEDGFKRTEVGVLPVEWGVVRLGDLMSFKNGINATREQYGSGYKFINVLDIIQNTTITYEAIIGQVDIDEKIFAANRVEKGDILFQRSSETIEEVGQANVYLGEKPVVFGGFVILGKKVAEYDPVFLNYLLKSSQARKSITSQSGGSTRYNISQSSLKKVAIPLPPLPEQRRIAAVLSDVDGLLAGLDAVVAKKEAVKVGVMEGLLTGRRRLAGFGREWDYVKLSEVVDVDAKSLSSDTDDDYEFSYISLEAVSKGEIGPLATITYGSSPSRARRIVSTNDVLLGTVRPQLQSHAIWTRSDKDIIASTGFAVLTPKEEIDGYFLYYQIMSKGVSNQINLALIGSNYPAINSKEVKALELPLPPLPEQRAIAGVLSALDAELGALRLRRRKLRALRAGLLGDLLSGRVRV